jgi:hypothetical protein
MKNQLSRKKYCQTHQLMSNPRNISLKTDSQVIIFENLEEKDM